MTITVNDLVPVRITTADGHDSLSWVMGQNFMLPRSLAEDRKIFQPSSAPDEYALKPADALKYAPLAASLRHISAFTETPPTSSRLPIPYQLVPVAIRDRIAKHIGKRNRKRQHLWARFPLFPLDLSSDFLADLSGLPNPFRVGPTPVILTHDLDAAEGLTNLVRLFLPLEERVGARSVNFMPARAYNVDMGFLDEVAARGHEIGVHGYDHNNLTAFCPQSKRDKRLAASRWLIERFGACGYRAPSLLRTKVLFQSLPTHFGPQVYDSSIPTAGGLFPVPNNGCASARPFTIMGIRELPLSMPRDGSLLFLGYHPPDILDLWKRCCDTISDSGGVVVLLTHCERRFSGGKAMLDNYKQFLEWIAQDSRFAFSTPPDILKKLG